MMTALDSMLRGILPALALSAGALSFISMNFNVACTASQASVSRLNALVSVILSKKICWPKAPCISFAPLPSLLAPALSSRYKILKELVPKTS